MCFTGDKPYRWDTYLFCFRIVNRVAQILEAFLITGTFPLSIFTGAHIAVALLLSYPLILSERSCSQEGGVRGVAFPLASLVAASEKRGWLHLTEL